MMIDLFLSNAYLFFKGYFLRSQKWNLQSVGWKPELKQTIFSTKIERLIVAGMGFSRPVTMPLNFPRVGEP
jgi:hypothetical protein